jgi:hypothetical protein
MNSAVPEKMPRQNNSVMRSTVIRRTKKPDVDQNTAAITIATTPQSRWRSTTIDEAEASDRGATKLG